LGIEGQKHRSQPGELHRQRSSTHAAVEQSNGNKHPVTRVSVDTTKLTQRNHSSRTTEVFRISEPRARCCRGRIYLAMQPNGQSIKSRSSGRARYARAIRKLDGHDSFYRADFDWTVSRSTDLLGLLLLTGIVGSCKSSALDR
jgi:hypothetical protein